MRHAAAVLTFLTIDTAVVLSRGGADSAWFDLSGSAALMLATVGGGVLYRVAARRYRVPRQPPPDGTHLRP